MTNCSKERSQANKIIRQLLEFSSEEYIQQVIEEPVQRILADFDFDKNAEFSNSNFLKVIAEFTRRLCLDGPGVRMDLSHDSACAEAVNIIENAYRNEACPAYDAALADGMHDMSNVIARMAEFSIDRMRKNHIKWVYGRLDSLNFNTQCIIVEMLKDQFLSFLPQAIILTQPAHLVDAIPHLITSINATLSTVNEVRRSGIDFS